MQFRYPRSFFKLLAVAFILAVLPLLAGLVSNTVAIQRLAVHSQQAVFDAARIAHASRQLAELLPTLERAARQSEVLQDAALRAGYERLRSDFVGLIAELERMPLDDEMRGLLSRMRALENELHASQGKGRLSASRFSALTDTGRDMLAHSSAVIDREAQSLKARASEAETSASIQLLVVVPVALLVVAGFTYLLARPIAQLKAGIRGIGEQRLHEVVQVEGPDDLVKLGEELDWLRQRLQQLEAQKAQFLRHVSHELKTPLTALREGSELLAEGTAGALLPRQQEIVGIVRDNSIHLQYLIEDLLRHGEAEFRSTRVEHTAFFMPALLEQLAARHRIALEARQLKLISEVQVATVVSDPERIRVVLDNLLSNAIKHAPAGSEVTVSAQMDNTALLLRVQDAGPGVLAADRERIFEPFYRGATPAGSKVKSTGLGLSICRDHVHALGGSIVVGEGQGDFCIRLPMEHLA